MTRPELIPLAVVALATAVAAATDLARFRVYNALTLPTLAAGLVGSALMGGLWPSLAGAALGFGLMASLYAIGGVGAGDVKLFAAVGAWLGPAPTLVTLAASALVAGVYALGLAYLRGGFLGAAVEVSEAGRMAVDPGRWRRPAIPIAVEVGRPDRRRRLVPFAAMTCVGYLLALAIGSLGPPDVRTFAADRPAVGGLR